MVCELGLTETIYLIEILKPLSEEYKTKLFINDSLDNSINFALT